MGSGGNSIVRCPRCRPIATKITRTNGARLGWQPEALYVGYLVIPKHGVYRKPPADCPSCGSLLVNNPKQGQALVEFALILPILLFIILGSIEAGFLIIEKARQDRETSVVAEWAAGHDNDSWRAVANKGLPGCDVEVTSPLPDLVQATSRCQYRPKVLVGFPIFDGLPISSREAAVRLRTPEPLPSAGPSPSVTPAASPSS